MGSEAQGRVHDYIYGTGITNKLELSSAIITTDQVRLSLLLTLPQLHDVLVVYDLTAMIKG
jgi:hypothetical protein